jgi:hypothetical protein
MKLKIGSNAVNDSRVKVSVGHKKEGGMTFIKASKGAINQRGKLFSQELGH